MVLSGGVGSELGGWRRELHAWGTAGQEGCAGEGWPRLATFDPSLAFC